MYLMTMYPVYNFNLIVILNIILNLKKNVIAMRARSNIILYPFLNLTCKMLFNLGCLVQSYLRQIICSCNKPNRMFCKYK